MFSLKNVILPAVLDNIILNKDVSLKNLTEDQEERKRKLAVWIKSEDETTLIIFSCHKVFRNVMLYAAMLSHYQADYVRKKLH